MTRAKKGLTLAMTATLTPLCLSGLAATETPDTKSTNATVAFTYEDLQWMDPGLGGGNW